MKKKIFTSITVLAVVALISGVTLLATAAPGDSSDPLITLSYLNGPFRTLVNTDITNAINGLNTRIANAETSLKAEMETARSATGNVFKLVKLPAGATETFAAGSELMLQIGGASFTASGGDLVCRTGTPAALKEGSLTANSMYLSTGSVKITAGSSGAEIWVRNGG